MDERFLFRGKRKDNGELVEGYLYITHDGKYEIAKYCDETNIERIAYEVIPKTVGQCTGLKDKNGKLIFEGDIVFVCDDNGFADLSDTGKGNVIFYKSMWYIDGEIQNLLYDICRNYYVEVIGNVHDTPELLEVER